MSSIRSRSIVASLFDLRSVVENKQVQIVIDAYEQSDKDEESIRKILEPYKVHGTIVLTDSSGLTKLSQTYNLLEILSLIQIPKELIYNLGKKLSGESIGVWAADNTAMFYHDTASSEDIAILHLLLQECLEHEKVQIGIGIHTGEFYRIGNNFYGKNYSIIDEVAENKAHGGEILVSTSTKGIIENQSDEDERFIFTERIFDEPIGKDTIFYTMKPGELYHDTLTQKADTIHLDDSNGTYHIAIPFPIRFYRAIISYIENQDIEKLEKKTKKYFHEKTILLVQTHKDIGEKGSDKEILEGLLLDTILRNTVRKFSRKHGGNEIKTGGGMSIIAFDSDNEAINVSILIREALASQDISCSAGIAKGEILIFRIGSSRQDCAGSPINIASKLGQDIANIGEILISSSIQVDKKIPQRSFTHKISGVTMSGVKI